MATRKWDVYKVTRKAGKPGVFSYEKLGQVLADHQPMAWKEAAQRWPQWAKPESEYRNGRLLCKVDGDTTGMPGYEPETVAKSSKPRLTWRKQPNETGLRSIGQGPRGAILKVDGEDVGRVYAYGRGITGDPHRGWYWTARDNAGHIPLRNTAGKPVKDLEEAKAACKAYVLECLAKTGGAES